MATAITAAGVDLDDIFEPRASTKVADVNIHSNGGVDLSNRFENITSGTGPAATNILKNTNTDLNEIFAEIGTTDPSVSLNTAGVTINADVSTVIAGVKYNTDGTEKSTNADGNGTYDVSRGIWLDTGLNSEAWFERTIISGTLNNSDPGSGRLIMTSARTVAVQDTSYAGGPVTCTVKITMWDAASGGSKLDETTYTLSAERQA
jgi:hypothetical protein